MACWNAMRLNGIVAANPARLGIQVIMVNKVPHPVKAVCYPTHGDSAALHNKCRRLAVKNLDQKPCLSHDSVILCQVSFWAHFTSITSRRLGAATMMVATRPQTLKYTISTLKGVSEAAICSKLPAAQTSRSITRSKGHKDGSVL